MIEFRILRLRSIPLVAFLLTMSGVLSSSLAAKSYQIPSIEVVAAVQPDGRLIVDERIQYRFKGRYSYAFRTIPLLPGEEVSNLSIREQGVEYRPAEDESPATFRIEGEDSGFEVRWFFQARNESRTFQIRYEILGAVHRYPDIAELHYKFLGEGWSKRIGSFQARVELPPGTAGNSVSAWAGDPLRGSVQVGSEEVVFSAQNWPRRSAFRGRVLFSAAAVPGLPVEGSRPMKTEIQQAEEEAREEALAAAVRRRELAEALFPWMFVFPLATWIGWYLLFLQHGKRHQVRPNVPSGHLPEQDPLFARWVRHRAVGGETLVATLFDLARRGYFNIREEQPETARAGKKKNSDYHFEIQRKSPAELRPFEKDLIDFVSTQVGDSRGFRISNLKRFAKKHQSRFQKWFRNWSKSFKVEAAGENIFEPYPLGPMVLNLLLGLSVVIVGAVVCILTSSPTGLPAIILGALQMIFTTFLSRRTPEGQRLFQEWTNFRKHVRNGDLVRLQLQEHWDTALIAALSLGLVKKFNLVLEHANPDILIIPWFDSAKGDVTGIAGISSSIQSMVSTVSSTTTSAAGAAGAGAAASGGGGGGAG